MSVFENKRRVLSLSLFKDIEKLNISNSHTKKLLNGISELKTAFKSNTSGGVFNDDGQTFTSSQNQKSIEITKLSMKYSINSSIFENAELFNDELNCINNNDIEKKQEFTSRKRSFNENNNNNSINNDTNRSNMSKRRR